MTTATQNSFVLHHTAHSEFNGSSVIDEAYYDSVSEQLAIVFVNGRVSVYEDVFEAYWDDFVKAHSAGTYYNDYIKGYMHSVFHGDKSDFITVDRSADVGAVENTESIEIDPGFGDLPPTTTVFVAGEGFTGQITVTSDDVQNAIQQVVGIGLGDYIKAVALDQ